MAKLASQDVAVLHLEVTRPSWSAPKVYRSDERRDRLLRPSEKLYASTPTDPPTPFVLLVIDVRKQAFMTSLFQTGMMGFACFVLLLAYFSGFKDADRFIVKPLTSILKVANRVIRTPLDIQSNPGVFDAALSFPEKTELEFEEHAKIMDFFASTSLLLSSSLNLVADKILTRKHGSILMPGSSYKAFICKLRLNSLFDRLGTVEEGKAHLFVQELHDLVYRTADRFLGACTPARDESFLLVWQLHMDDKDRVLKSGRREASEAACLMVTAVLKICAKIGLINIDYGLPEQDEEEHSPDNRVALELADNQSYYSSAGSYQAKSSRIESLRYPRPKITNFAPDFMDFATCVMDFGEVSETLVQTETMISVVYGGLDLLKIRALERLTRVYSLPILLTEKVYSMLGECMKKKCRKIDIVMDPGAEVSHDLFSIDVSCSRLCLQGSLTSRLEARSGIVARRKHLMIREHIIASVIKGAKNQVFFEDPDIQSLFVKRTEFNSSYRKALDYYSLGAWDAAKLELDKAIELDPKDGACQFLYSFMESYGFQRPYWWRGYRLLE